MEIGVGSRLTRDVSMLEQSGMLRTWSRQVQKKPPPQSGGGYVFEFEDYSQFVD